MVKKTDVKAVGIVVLGVLLAGGVMFYFAGNEQVDNVRAGFGG